MTYEKLSKEIVKTRKEIVKLSNKWFDRHMRLSKMPNRIPSQWRKKFVVMDRMKHYENLIIKATTRFDDLCKEYAKIREEEPTSAKEQFSHLPYFKFNK